MVGEALQRGGSRNKWYRTKRSTAEHAVMEKTKAGHSTEAPGFQNQRFLIAPAVHT
ncbi:hypothetical protein SAMN05443582_108165 [Phyllobacterium sp. OV277]|nr:hypothetical protein SAMN05443582_108165 [Phyllobacterium sp. OV277]